MDNSEFQEDKDEDMDMDERNSYYLYLCDHLEKDILYERYPYDRETIDAIIDLMLDTICSKRKYIRIAGDDKPAAVVRSQFMKLDFMHIEYVLGCMKNNGSKVRNIKQYLLASCFDMDSILTASDRRFACHDLPDELLLILDKLPRVRIKRTLGNITEDLYLRIGIALS